METDLRDRYFNVLMEGLSSCQYPSTSMMDRLEEAVRDRVSAKRYIELLLDHLESDDYPSPPLLDRVAHLIEVLEQS